MTVHLHWLTRRRIHRLFTQELKSSCHRALLQDLSGCGACAKRYNSYQILEAALCGTGGGHDATVFAIERLRNAVLDGTNVASKPHREEAHVKLTVRLAGAAFAATAAIVLFALRPWSSGHEHVAISASASLADVKVVARSGTPKVSEIGIRLFKVEAPEAADNAGRHRVNETGFLANDDVITFTYTNVRPEIRYAAIFGIQADGVIRWYYPSYGGKVSIPIHGDKVDEPLEDGIRLQVHHTPGWLRVTAVFSTDPILAETISRAVRLKRAKSPDALMDLGPLVLPGTETLQHSLLTHIVPAP